MVKGNCGICNLMHDTFEKDYKDYNSFVKYLYNL